MTGDEDILWPEIVMQDNAGIAQLGLLVADEIRRGWYDAIAGAEPPTDVALRRPPYHRALVDCPSSTGVPGSLFAVA